MQILSTEINYSTAWHFQIFDEHHNSQDDNNTPSIEEIFEDDEFHHCNDISQTSEVDEFNDHQSITLAHDVIDIDDLEMFLHSGGVDNDSFDDGIPDLISCAYNVDDDSSGDEVSIDDDILDIYSIDGDTGPPPLISHSDCDNTDGEYNGDTDDGEDNFDPHGYKPPS